MQAHSPCLSAAGKTPLRPKVRQWWFDRDAPLPWCESSARFARAGLAPGEAHGRGARTSARSPQGKGPSTSLPRRTRTVWVSARPMKHSHRPRGPASLRASLSVRARPRKAKDLGWRNSRGRRPSRRDGGAGPRRVTGRQAGSRSAALLRLVLAPGAAASTDHVDGCRRCDGPEADHDPNPRRYARTFSGARARCDGGGLVDGRGVGRVRCRRPDGLGFGPRGLGGSRRRRVRVSARCRRRRGHCRGRVGRGGACGHCEQPAQREEHEDDDRPSGDEHQTRDYV